MSIAQEADDVQRQMSRIRCELNEDVDDIVANARVMSDWRYYVRAYPWVCAAGAAALGYLVVPARMEVISPDPKTLAKLAKEHRLIVKPEAEPHKRGGIVGPLFTLLASTLVRGLVAYLGQVAGQNLSDTAVARGIGPAEPKRP